MDVEKQRAMYASALNSQGAVNAFAVVKDLAGWVDIMREEADALGKGTDYVNQHPVMRLVMEQLHHLACGGLGYDNAAEECEERRRFGHALPVDWKVTLVVSTPAGKKELEDRVHEFANGSLLKDVRGEEYRMPVNGISIRIEKAKEFKDSRRWIGKLMWRKGDGLLRYDIKPTWQGNPDEQERQIALADLLTCVLQDNQAAREMGHGVIGPIYINRLDETVRLEAMNDRDAGHIEVLMDFVEQNYMEGAE